MENIKKEELEKLIGINFSSSSFFMILLMK